MKTELVLCEFLDSRISSNLSHRTIEWYEDRLLPLFPLWSRLFISMRNTILFLNLLSCLSCGLLSCSFMVVLPHRGHTASLRR